MRTLPGWFNIRTAICHAPVYQEPGSYRGRCMLCDIPTYFHPREPSDQPYGLDGVSWHRLRDGERDRWSDILEIMGE